MTIRVLIIDDSATMRAILASRLSGEPGITVVGGAADAAQGRALIKQCDPDVVTLDIEMPGMNGLDFLEKIMALRPTPVIIVSGATQAGNAVTARALALGAVDCYAKPTGAALGRDDGGRLVRMIRQAAQIDFKSCRQAQKPPSAPRRPAMAGDTELIAIGSSTGGIEALQTLLSGFPADCPPTMIVQHVNPRFAVAIARTLDAACPAKVMIAEADMPLTAGCVYLAPGGDRHLTIYGAKPHRARLRRGDPVSGHLPSVDMLFQSVAAIVGPQAVGIVLTGMGSDGAQGLLALARSGALTIVQDEATCTVFGMPRAAIALGAATVIAPIHEIARHALERPHATDRLDAVGRSG